MAGYKWTEIPSIYQNIVKDKKLSANAYFRYNLARFSRMFEYKNLPDTIPHEILDRYLMTNGIALITKVNGKLYAFSGNLGGPQDVYYRPTLFVVANPHIKTEDGQLFSANIPISTIITDASTQEEPQGVLMRNDTEWFGLAPILSRYSYLMAENILTLRTADVMLRITSLISAPTDKERIAAEEYIKALEKGEFKVIGESAFFDGIKLQSPPSNNGSYLTQFIEYQQYLKGSMFNELGLVANYNMKREAIGTGESTLDEDATLPLVDNMLLCRKEDMKRVNEFYGTDIEVNFSSTWLSNLIETKSQLITLQAGQTGQISQPINENGESDESGQSGQSGATQPAQSSQSNASTHGVLDREIDTKGADEENETKENGENSENNLDDGVGDSESSENEKENPGSVINDTVTDGFLEEMDEKLDELMRQPMTDINSEGGDRNEESETSEDKEDNPDD